MMKFKMVQDQKKPSPIVEVVTKAKIKKKNFKEMTLLKTLNLLTKIFKLKFS